MGILRRNGEDAAWRLGVREGEEEEEEDGGGGAKILWAGW